MADQITEEREAPLRAAQADHDRLVFYFRSLGLGEDAVEAAIRKVLARLGAAAADGSDSQRARAAIPEAVSLVARWLERVAGAPEREISAQGQLLWRVRTALLQPPGLACGIDEPSEAIRRAVCRSCRPILPPEDRIPMPVQSLGSLPRILCRTFWQGLPDWFAQRVSRAARALTRR